MTIAQIELITRNRQPHEHQAGVRFSVLDGAVAEFRATMERLGLAEAHVAACTCQRDPCFEIVERGTGGYRAMEQARIERLLFEDARGCL